MQIFEHLHQIIIPSGKMTQLGIRKNSFFNSIIISVFVLVLIILHTANETQSANTITYRNVGSENEPEVDTSCGKVRGFHDSTPWGNVIKYYGIPYAEPPTNSKRFKESVPLLGQESTVHSRSSPAVHFYSSSPPACMQNVHLPEFSHPSLPQGAKKVSEDCLRLNVFQPGDLKPTDRLPMILWIPGDGYGAADSNQYDGSALASLGKVIVITVNYRVGVFGFASSGNATLPGNAGLSDIVSAVKFMTFNAESFLGDSENITLAGRFSGGMAISTLATSDSFYKDKMRKQPIAKRMIIHGGAATSKYNVDSNPSDAFESLANSANCFTGHGDHTLECLQAMDSVKLLEIAQKVPYSWRPVIDGVNIRKNPLDAIKFGEFSSDISFLIGDNSGSGAICYIIHKYLNSAYFQSIVNDDLTENDFLAMAMENIKEFYKIGEPALGSLVSHEYFYREPTEGTLSWRRSYFDFCGALYIRTPVELFARYTSRLNSIVYRYEFAYKASTSIFPNFLTGALGDEITFVFPTNTTKFNEQDQKTFNLFIESWANFIKTGDPSSSHTKWEHFNEIDKSLVGFTGTGVLKSTTNILNPDVHFWRDVIPQLSETLTSRKEMNQTKCPTPPIAQEAPNGLQYLGVMFLIIITALGLVSVVNLIRNWQKPYIWKFG